MRQEDMQKEGQLSTNSLVLEANKAMFTRFCCAEMLMDTALAKDTLRSEVRWSSLIRMSDFHHTCGQMHTSFEVFSGNKTLRRKVRVPLQVLCPRKRCNPCNEDNGP